MTAIAIVKPIKVRKGNLAGLKAVIDYVKDSAKTKDGSLVYMSGGINGNEFKQMVITKELFGKTTGRQYAHFVQSFDKDNNITPELAFQVGKGYIDRLEKGNDFQILMAVHTDREHLHIHYIINSVNSKDGSKWQCSQKDLQHFREMSDALCRKYNLNVIERGRKCYQSYGEYTASKNDTSWKTLLAKDIASCLEKSKSRAEFLHRLDKLGIDADFGKSNVMFTISKGTYGLNEEMKCSNYKLMSYRDFSKQNIENHFKLNIGISEYGSSDIQLYQDCLLELGRIKFPDNPTQLQDMYFANVDFDNMTKDEIEAYIRKITMERLQRKAWAEREAQNRKSSYVLENIDLLLEELVRFFDSEQYANYDYGYDDKENEFEL